MRYIDADLIRYDEDIPGVFIASKTRINNIPTADVVEVVRCKDCKHRKKNTFCLHNMRYEDDNGFCSYGERGRYER